MSDLTKRLVGFTITDGVPQPLKLQINQDGRGDLRFTINDFRVDRDDFAILLRMIELAAQLDDAAPGTTTPISSSRPSAAPVR